MVTASYLDDAVISSFLVVILSRGPGLKDSGGGETGVTWYIFYWITSPDTMYRIAVKKFENPLHVSNDL